MQHYKHIEIIKKQSCAIWWKRLEQGTGCTVGHNPFDESRCGPKWPMPGTTKQERAEATRWLKIVTWLAKCVYIIYIYIHYFILILFRYHVFQSMLYLFLFCQVFCTRLLRKWCPHCRCCLCKHCFGSCLNQMEVSIVMRVPRSWMVYNRKSYKNGWWLVPLWVGNHQMTHFGD